MAAQAEASGVLFTDFTNSERIKFLLSMTSAGDDTLRFLAITDFDMAPDPSTRLPNEIGPFLQKVRQLNFLGEELQDSFFLKNIAYHDYVLLSRMEMEYHFAYHAAKGKAVVAFGFSGYSLAASSPSEFEANVSSVTLEREYRHVNKKKVVEHITDIVSAFSWTMIQARRGDR